MVVVQIFILLLYVFLELFLCGGMQTALYKRLVLQIQASFSSVREALPSSTVIYHLVVCLRPFHCAFLVVNRRILRHWTEQAICRCNLANFSVKWHEILPALGLPAYKLVRLYYLTDVLSVRHKINIIEIC